jgi:dipeptidyl aminopeptidase/acylaminoacyl peptidase
VSFQGTADCRSAFDRYLGVVDEDPETHWLHSPVRYVKAATTPTLIVYGEKDARVPPSQGHELHQGLRARGVETRLVLYPREAHAVVERHHQVDLLNRVIDWFDTHLDRAGEGSAQ